MRIDNAFMEAVADGRPLAPVLADREGEGQDEGRPPKPRKTLQARDLWDQIAYAAWACADPGVQFDTTINEWHTCPADGRINASNPCVTGDTLVATAEGLIRIDELLDRRFEVLGSDGRLHRCAARFPDRDQTGLPAAHQGGLSS